MQSLELNDPVKIQEILGKISLKGQGFTTECLLADVYDAGLDYPDFLRLEGEDANASYGGCAPAWAVYHVRQGKRVFMVYGGANKTRACRFTETP